jgi:hypothetical protein
VPFPQLGPTGYIIPSDSDILAGVCTDLQAAFGGNLNLDPANTITLSTPQGQLANSLAAIISDCFAQFLTIVPQVDPLYAQGRMQDAIGYIYFMTRFPAKPTLVTATCNGTEGTIIPSGSTTVAIDGAGNLYSCPAGATIGSGSMVSGVTFSNQTPGETPYVGPMSIYQSIAGWSSITSAIQSELGNNVETQQEFEARRSASVGINSNGSLEAILASILACYQGLACACAENPSAAPVVIQGVTLPANSIYISVAQVGGSLSAAVGILIAQAIYAKKASGSPYAVADGSGNPKFIPAGGSATTPFYATDPISGQLSPIGFAEAVQTPLNFVITLAAATNPPSTAQALAAQAINNAFTGADGQAPVGSQIGGVVYQSRFYKGLATLLPDVAILGVQIYTGVTPPVAGSGYSQAFDLNQIPIQGNMTVALV